MNCLSHFFGAKRRLLDFNRDLMLAMDPALPEGEQRRRIGEVLKKHDPVRFAREMAKSSAVDKSE